MAMAVLLLSGCEQREETSSGETSSLPINVANSNYSVESEVVSSSSDYDYPDIPEEPLFTPAKDSLLRTTMAEGGSLRIDNKNYNLVPEYGVKMPNGTNLSTIFLQGFFYDITDIPVKDFFTNVDLYGARIKDNLETIALDEGTPTDLQFAFQGFPLVTGEGEDEDICCYVEIVDKNGKPISDITEMVDISKMLDEEYMKNYDYAGYSVKSIIARGNKDESSSVMTAGGIELGKIKQQAIRELGDGYEIRNGQYLYSCYKTNDTTLMVRYAYDDLIGWWVETVYLFRNSL